MIKKNLPAFVLLAFLALVGVWNLLTPDRAFSEAENRMLTARPVLSPDALLSGDYMKGFDAWLTDQFAGRDAWVGLKAGLATGLGQRESGGIYVAGDRLIPRVDEPGGQLVETNLAAVAALMENSGAPVSLMLIPSAAALYGDALPAGAPTFDEAGFLETVADRFKGRFSTPLPLLKDHRGEEIYYLTDHHWTTLGAYYGYRALMAQLGMEPLPLPETAEVVSDNFRGTSVSASGLYNWQPDSIVRRVDEPESLLVTRTEGGVRTEGSLYDHSALDTKDQYRYFLGGNQPLISLETGADGPRLLILRDSYMDSLAPYLLAHFSAIHLVDLRYFRGSVPALIEELGADQVVAAYSVANFISDANLVLAGSP